MIVLNKNEPRRLSMPENSPATPAQKSSDRDENSRLQKKGDTVETVEDSVRVIKIVTSQEGDTKTITELYMLGDLLTSR